MIRSFLKSNSSLLFTIGAGAGVVSTGYLAARAGYKHAQRMGDQDPYMSVKEEASLVWRLYVPAAAAGAATIVCLSGVKRIDGKRALAAQGALALSQGAYERYREEVVAELGSRKDQEFVAKGAQRQVNEAGKPAIVIGDGSVLCFEMFTGRYFMSDQQKLLRAVNVINDKLNKHDYATLDDFYYEIGLEYTHGSGQSGWKSGKLLDLEFSSVLHEGKPCLAFNYNYVTSF